MASTTADMPTREEMQAEINSSKPIPPPNLDAQSTEEVWTLESLIGLQTLRGVQVKEWIETIQNGDEITCKSRFVAHRIAKLVASKDVKNLRGLRYLLLLVEWYHALKKGARGVLRVPRKEDLLQGWPSELVDGVGRRFAEGGELNTWHKHNLLTHILALALVLDGGVTDTRDIRDDLRLDSKEYVPTSPFPSSPHLSFLATYNSPLFPHLSTSPAPNTLPIFPTRLPFLLPPPLLLPLPPPHTLLPPIPSQPHPSPSPPHPQLTPPPHRISTLHSELACPLSPPTEPELKRLKMSKTEAVQSGHRFARVRLPLLFPRMRLGRGRGR